MVPSTFYASLPAVENGQTDLCKALHSAPQGSSRHIQDFFRIQNTSSQSNLCSLAVSCHSTKSTCSAAFSIRTRWSQWHRQDRARSVTGTIPFLAQQGGLHHSPAGTWESTEAVTLCPRPTLPARMEPDCREQAVPKSKIFSSPSHPRGRRQPRREKRSLSRLSALGEPHAEEHGGGQ